MSLGSRRIRAGTLGGARIFIAGLIIAAGVLLLGDRVGLAANGLAASANEIPTIPAVGGVSAIIRIHFVADGYDGNYGGDYVAVTGPSGTPCASDVAYGDVIGPHEDASGPATVYIGPVPSRQYPWAVNAIPIISAESRQPLTRWCAGTYSGHVGYFSPTGSGGTDDNFQFRIVAHGSTKLLTTVARHLRSVTVKPDRGDQRAVFAVRYRADSTPYDSGDVVEIYGPSHSACRGRVLRAKAGPSDKRSQSLTLHIGPGAAYYPYGDNGTGKPLRRWCSGTYHGTLFYEHGPKFTVVARFKLHVAA